MHSLWSYLIVHITYLPSSFIPEDLSHFDTHGDNITQQFPTVNYFYCAAADTQTWLGMIVYD